MSVVVTAPLRIDIAGGVTDIPEFGAAVGTSVVNIAIDVSYEPDFCSPLGITAESYFSETQQLFINDQSVDLNEVDQELQYIRKLLSSYVNARAPGQAITLKITNSLPKSTGLGGSAALLVAALTSLHKLNGEPTDADTIINAARRFEALDQQIPGGFQDYVAAYFGGLNYIDFTSLETTHLENHPNLGNELPKNVQDYLNQSMLLVLLRSGNTSSGKIVAEEIENFMSDREVFEPQLLTIKNANAAIADSLQDTHSWMNHINQSWQAQKQLSPLVGGGLLASLEEEARPFVDALRGPGSGSNSLFILVKPGCTEQLLERLAPFESKVLILYVRTNNQGVRTLQTESL